MVEEQRKKAFLLRKAEMLSSFEVEEGEKAHLLTTSTVSQTMQNALDAVGDPAPNVKVPDGRLTVFGKETFSKFMHPLENGEKELVGHKPCARDGCISLIYDKRLFIFGGDRHTMCFNDLYSFDLSKV